MAAEDNLGRQWQQLDMFRPAKDLRLKTVLGDVESEKIWDYGKTAPDVIEKQVMDQKLEESKTTGLYDSIKEKGVKNPVYLGRSNTKSIMSDGHHRVAAAYDIDPNMLIPVEHG
jgi:hypothetical protein